MLKLIMFFSVVSLLIGGITYSPNAQAGWLEDAIKEKAKRELRRKIRKEARRNNHRRHQRRENHREGRNERNRNENRRNRAYPVKIALQKIYTAQEKCLNYSRTWRGEALCFQKHIRQIRQSVARSIRKQRLSENSYEILRSMQHKLNNMLNRCIERTNTWKRAARCFNNKLQNLAQNTKSRYRSRYRH